MKIKFYYIILIIIIFLYSRTIYLFYFNDSRILGQDRFFIEDELDENNCYGNYPLIEYEFEKEIDNLEEIIINKLAKNLNNKKSLIRKKLIDDKTYEYSIESIEKIISYTLKKINSKESYNYDKIIKETSQNPNKFKIFINKKKIYFSGSHLFYDGASIFNNINLMFDYSEKINVKKFKYIPIYNEIKLIQTIPNLLKLFNSKKNLSYDYHYNKYRKPKEIVNFNIDIKALKKIKNKINNNLLKNDKISFPVILATLQIIILFNSTKKNKLNIGITVAFANKGRSNNFSALPILIDKPKNVNNLNDSNFMIIFYEIIFKLNDKINEYKNLLLTIYSVTNIYNFNFSTNKKLDILISSIPITIKTKLTINKVNIKNINAVMFGHTMPIYILNLSTTDCIYSNIHIRTDEVDINKIKYFTDNINKWLNHKINIKDNISYLKNNI